MMRKPFLDEALIAAYRNTEYRVFSVPDVVFFIDRPCLALRDLFDEHAASSACFVTAYNPFSQLIYTRENEERQLKLISIVEESGWPWVRGEGSDPTGQWPPEPSILVLQLNADEAETLGARFGQNAIVWIDSDFTPRLLFPESDRMKEVRLTDSPNDWKEINVEGIVSGVRVKLRKAPGLNPMGEYMSINRNARVAREYITAHLKKGDLRAGRYEVERGIIIDVTKRDDD